MRTVTLHNGRQLQQPETEQEWLDMQPEAKLRELFSGDVEGMQRFHDRLRDLDARHARWVDAQPGRKFWDRWGWLIYVIAHLAGFPRKVAKEARP